MFIVLVPLFHEEETGTIAMLIVSVHRSHILAISTNTTYVMRSIFTPARAYRFSPGARSVVVWVFNEKKEIIIENYPTVVDHSEVVDKYVVST